MKFGGTSLGSAERMEAVAQLLPTQEPVIVVLSAMAGTTNRLEEIAQMLAQGHLDQAQSLTDALESHYHQVLEDLYSDDAFKLKGETVLATSIHDIRSQIKAPFEPVSEKIVLAQGELLSTQLFQIFLEEKGMASVLLPALDFMRLTPEDEPDQAYIRENLLKQLAEHAGANLFITQGYICRNARHEIDNLTRGGSDYTASLLGAAVRAQEIQIWTDIDGMHNNDPRLVQNTSPIAELSFNEAAELAYFGAKILHPSSILPARQQNIPVRLLNTLRPQAPGTTISVKKTGNSIKAVAAKDGLVAINITSSRMLQAHGYMRNVFEVFERFRTSIDMITTTEVAISLTIDNPKYLTEITAALQRFGLVEIDTDLTIICVVGDFMEDQPGVTAHVVGSLKTIPLRMISYGGSKNNISFLINSTYKQKALIALHQGIFQDKVENQA